MVPKSPKRNLPQTYSDDWYDMLHHPKHTDHSIDVYEDLRLKNRSIGFIWDEPKLIIVEGEE